MKVTSSNSLSKTYLIAAIIALVPVTTAAVDMPDWYASVGLSHISSDNKRIDDNDIAPTLAIGAMLAEDYSLDLEYNDYRFSDGSGRSADFSGFNLTGRYYFQGNDKTSPYVGLGFGSLQRKDRFGSESDTHLDLAAGMQWLIGDRWGLRGELRHRFAGDDDDPANVNSFEDFEDLSVSLSVTYAFSTRVKATPRSTPAPKKPLSKPKTTFILLPDEDGTVGRIVVSNDAGEQEISEAGYEVGVSSAQNAPTEPREAEQAEIDEVFGPVQNAFPKTPKHFQLYFEFESTILTAESKVQIPEIIATIDPHQAVEVGVVGHSDTSGEESYNLSLSERRANAIVKLLISKGVNEELIYSRFDGENNPIVPTADNVKELKNRRVEITIR